jgi:hypothetical protein
MITNTGNRSQGFALRRKADRRDLAQEILAGLEIMATSGASQNGVPGFTG